MKLAVFAHEPLTDSGWEEIDPGCSPDEAANLMRAWGAKGWRVLCLSTECVAEGWEMNWPVLES